MAKLDDFDQDIGEDDIEEEFSFPPGERKIVTQPIDLSVSTLDDQWKNKIIVLPDTQREYVWDSAKASRLIESLILNIPIPVLYFAETEDARYEIFDGHQRIRSIVNYLGGVFPLSGLAVLREYKGMRYTQLPEREQRFLRMRTLRTILISIDSHPNMKFEIYERLNTGSISLNAQELRNSIYRGDLNDLLHELAKDDKFRNLLGQKTPRRRMVDEELILRFFAMREHLGTYRTPLKKFLNDYMAGTRTVSQDRKSRMRSEFNNAVGQLNEYLDSASFRVLNSRGLPIERNVNRALAESQLLAFSWLSFQSRLDRHKVVSEISHLFQNGQFTDAIQRATGDRARTLLRLRETVLALERAGGIIQVPYSLQA